VAESQLGVVPPTGCTFVQAMAALPSSSTDDSEAAFIEIAGGIMDRAPLVGDAARMLSALQLTHAVCIVHTYAQHILNGSKPQTQTAALRAVYKKFHAAVHEVIYKEFEVVFVAPVAGSAASALIRSPSVVVSAVEVTTRSGASGCAPKLKSRGSGAAHRLAPRVVGTAQDRTAPVEFDTANASDTHALPGTILHESCQSEQV
jgi:hypothetical protein